MPLPLFVYGTLRDDDVFTAVVGRTLAAYGPRPAQAPGYQARVVRGEVYPGLAVAPGRAAPGLVLDGLDQGALARLDRFEGDGYRRRPLDVHVGTARVAAEVYLPLDPACLSEITWTLEEWRHTGKARFLNEFPGFG
jgi:gamma-glutamylcyclotransferase (GGCT)/AIG2-like uncharacterized protein YtfP